MLMQRERWRTAADVNAKQCKSTHSSARSTFSSKISNGSSLILLLCKKLEWRSA